MDDLIGSLARNLRRYRALRGVSSSEVAQQSHIARATLSALESGRGNPTLDTLAAIASVLGVGVAELMAVEADAAMTVVRARDEAPDERGPFGLRLLRRFRAGPCAIDMYDLHVTDGITQMSDGHGEGVLEHILVQVGKLELRVDPDSAAGKHAIVGPGDFVSFTADAPHVYATVGEEVRATLIMHYAVALEPPPVPVEGVTGSVATAAQS